VEPAKTLEPSWLVKLLTTGVHLGIAAFFLDMIYMESNPLGTIAMQVCAAHFAFLLGLWGPASGQYSWWWVPSRDDGLGGTLFVCIGLVHYIGVGVISYDKLEHSPCSIERDIATINVYEDLLRTDPPVLMNISRPTATAFVNLWANYLSNNSCSLTANLSLVGSGCAATNVSSVVMPMTRWATSLSSPHTTLVTAGIQEAIAAAGCEWKALGPIHYLVLPWSFTDRLWFCLVLLTTVGYGNTFTPTTPQSRQFTMLWSIYGLFFFGASSSALVVAFGTVAERAGHVATRLLPWRTSTTTTTVDAPGHRGADYEQEQPSSLYLHARTQFANFVAFLVLNGCGAYIFYVVEERMTYFDAFYHCMMTATTIGLGDIAPRTQLGRAYGIVHMVLSVLLFGSILSTVLKSFSRRAQESKKEEMLRRQLDETLMEKLLEKAPDQSMDRADFILGMMEAVGVIEYDDYAPFVEQFRRFDRSGDGMLSKDDLKRYTRREYTRRENVNSVKKRTDIERLRGHMLNLVVPSFLAALGFLWASVFGFVLTASGLLNGLAIILALSPNPSRSTLRLVLILMLLGAAHTTLAMLLIGAFIINPSLFYKYDRLMELVQFGELNAQGKLTSMSPVAKAIVGDIGEFQKSTLMAQPAAWILFTSYDLCYLYSLVVTLSAAICAMRALRCVALCIEVRSAGAPKTASSAADMSAASMDNV